MSHFKKQRLISEMYRKNPTPVQNMDDNFIDKQKADEVESASIEKISDNRNLEEQACNNSKQNVKEEKSCAQIQNEDQVSKVLAFPRPSFFVPPRQKRTIQKTFEYIETERKAFTANYNWKLIQGNNLSVKYAKIYPKAVADDILANLENEVVYLGPEHSKVQVFGSWYPIARKHAAYGEEGLTYKYSNASLPAKSWDSCPTILELKRMAESATGETYNFVLINRYKDGSDYMGNHRDNEHELVLKSPIASFSFGQERDFLFRPYNKKNNHKQSSSAFVKQVLETGSLLIMEYPTNQYWTHGLPPRKKAPGLRVNLTFRRLIKVTV